MKFIVFDSSGAIHCTVEDWAAVHAAVADLACSMCKVDILCLDDSAAAAVS